ncbi:MULTISPECIES: hypothetical protein [unclassified Pseudomonas]|uniref:hypothetical protein n=1 Tax=unclassified Pseudomonas TaxID=196821 RepID=UPI000876C5EA|nr:MULTISPECIES: hypothetical protein [unclassified Pseudomonas]SCZ27866.1 hypothetical protein SAMN03159405_01923 [Pseudomonas sp. NFACC44-2]SDA75575.1 hypothetical protein SAMN03159429_03544 [Pseudomonas sp. NFACC51]SEJ31116.1 hypothetical protein SAMN03159298_02757 [Pseudomonas sp. NFACC07-1]SFH43598.1 hypothetical protein SAMN03159302_01538 [Pseudomonas sp. NFACC54]SFT15391.1 hypothetical protein SAMN03159306_04066 [Pseudomonas sp. NFACC48-1]
MIARLKHWGNLSQVNVPELKGALRYVFFVYSEFGLVALLTLYFINAAPASMLAESSITFIVISYSTFLAFGFHNGATRDAAVATTLEQRNEILRLELLFSSAVALVLLGIVLVFNPDFYLMAGMMIGAVNHLKVACQAIFRLNGENNRLNLLNVSCALAFFLLFTLSQGFAWPLPLEQAFFLAWLTATCLVVAIFYVVCGRKVGLFSRRPYDLSLFFRILKASKFMFVMAVGGSVLLTSDRVMLNLHQAGELIVANFQYVDTLSNIYFLGLSAVLYYFTPNLLRRYNSAGEEEGAANFLRSMKMMLFALVGVVLLFLVCASVLLFFLGRLEFVMFELLLSMLLMKSAMIMLGIVCNFYLANSGERRLAGYYIVVTCISLLATHLWVSLFSNAQMIFFLPLLNSAFIVVMFGALLMHIKAIKACK